MADPPEALNAYFLFPPVRVFAPGLFFRAVRVGPPSFLERGCIFPPPPMFFQPAFSPFFLPRNSPALFKSAIQDFLLFFFCFSLFIHNRPFPPSFSDRDRQGGGFFFRSTLPFPPDLLGATFFFFFRSESEEPFWLLSAGRVNFP